KFPELRPVFGTLLDDAFPPGLIGLGPVGLGVGAVELDGLYTGVGLPLRVFGVFSGEFGPSFRLPEIGRLAQHGFLSVVQFVPRRLVNKHRDLGGVEAGIDAIFCFLVPPKIKYAGDRPAITVDNAALERRIDFTWRSLHDSGAERLEEVTVDRRDADLQTSKVGL